MPLRLTRLQISDQIVSSAGTPVQQFLRFFNKALESIEDAVNGLADAIIAIQAAQDDATQALTEAQAAQADATQGIADAAAAQATADAAQPGDALLTSLAALSDPGADKIVFWDESANNFGFLEPAANLSITGTDLDASGGGSAAWALFNSWTFSTNVTEVDFTGLAGKTDILVIARAITLGTSGVIAVRVSTNNGSSFYATSGDYVLMAATGIETAATTAINLWNTGATAARSGSGIIRGANVTGAPRVCVAVDPAAATPRYFVADTANDIDAIRCVPTGGGNITGGSIYVFTR